MSADRLRSLVKEATRAEDWSASRMVADEQLVALAPQLAELVADMAEALDAICNAKSYVNASGYVVTADEAQELGIKRAADHGARLAALFPEDSA